MLIKCLEENRGEGKGRKRTVERRREGKSEDKIREEYSREGKEREE